MYVNQKRSKLIAGLVVALFAAACTSNSGKSQPSYEGAGEVCEGVFAGRLEKAVEAVTGATSFERRAGGGMDRLIEAIEKGYASGRKWAPGGELCKIPPKGTNDDDQATLAFHIYAPQDVNDSGSRKGERRFALGEEAIANSLYAGIYFECVSPRLDGSRSRPARIYGGLSKVHDRGDALENLMENLDVVHAASLAVAEKLECEGDAGLPKKLGPRLRELPPASRQADADSR